MKKWITLAAITLLAITNAITLSSLATATQKAGSYRAQLHDARVAAAQVESLRIKLNTAEEILGLRSEAYGNSERKVMLGVIDRWKALYDEAQQPFRIGDIVNGAEIVAVGRDSITIEHEGKRETLAIGEVSTLLRSRAALAMVGAKE